MCKKLNSNTHTIYGNGNTVFKQLMIAFIELNMEDFAWLRLTGSLVSYSIETPYNPFSILKKGWITNLNLLFYLNSSSIPTPQPSHRETPLKFG